MIFYHRDDPEPGDVSMMEPYNPRPATLTRNEYLDLCRLDQVEIGQREREVLWTLCGEVSEENSEYVDANSVPDLPLGQTMEEWIDGEYLRRWDRARL